MRTKMKIIMAIMLIAVAVLSGCASKEAEKNNITILQPEHIIDIKEKIALLKPDLIITPQGFSICEIETSPFGLALAEILNRAYQNQGFETMIADGTLPAQIQNSTPAEGSLIYSRKTQAYSGQMTFLADEVFSGNKRNWEAEEADNFKVTDQQNIYRGFYLGEYLTDPNIKFLLDRQIDNGNILIPSPTPHMEEKAILTLLYDKRYEGYLRKRLGEHNSGRVRYTKSRKPWKLLYQEEFFTRGEAIKRELFLKSGKGCFFNSGLVVMLIFPLNNILLNSLRH